jgi:hypothetical protein
MNVESPHLSQLELDRLALAGLAADRQAHLDSCERCRGEQAQLKALQQTFSTTVLPRTSSAVTERADWRASWSRFWIPSAALGAVAVVMLVLLVPPLMAPGDEDLGAKGDVSFSAVVKRGDQLLPAGQARPGDQVRLVLTGPAGGFVMVASIDGRGRASVYHPFDGVQSAAVEKAGRWELPGSIELDETQGPERLFALWSTQPLSASDVKTALVMLGARGWEAIRAAQSLEVPGVSHSQTILLEKP